MQVYFSFLRGVNIGGHNKIKMTDLTSMFLEAGYTDAETFIQSGNVIFSGRENKSASEVASEIESAIKVRFGFGVTALIRTPVEIKSVISLNPFLSERNFDPSKSAVIFLNEMPQESLVEKIKKITYPPDKFEIIGREVFIYCPNGFGRSKLYTNFFESKLKVSATGRNWNTLNTILEIAERKQRQG